MAMLDEQKMLEEMQKQWQTEKNRKLCQTGCKSEEAKKKTRWQYK
jgi:hypothetical protein